MARLKYIKRLYENDSKVEILSIDGHTVTLISPDGRQEVVEFEEDGEWEEWIDPPYVKEVSISGDGQKYRYYMTGTTDGHNSFEIEDSSNIDWEPLEKIKAAMAERARKSEESRRLRELAQKEKEDHINREISDRGITRLQYEVEEQIKSMKNQVDFREIPQDSDLTNYVVAKTRSWDSGENMYFNSYFKIPLGGQSFEEFESTLNMFKDLGMEEAMSGSFAGIPKDDEVVRIIKKGSDYKIPGYYGENEYTLKNLESYLDMAPFGVSLDPLFWTIHKYNKNSER